MMAVLTSTSVSRFQKPHHLLLEHASSICPCAVDDARIGEQLLEPRRVPVDRGHPVVHPEDLALAEQFAPDGAARQPSSYAPT